MTEVLGYLLAAWLLWALFNLGVMLLGALLEPMAPHFDGFRIRVPKWATRVLTNAELQALLEHEAGHRQRGHVWVNFARTCGFRAVTLRQRREQELEADDAVSNPLALAAMIYKLSMHPFDRLRADRALRRVHGRNDWPNQFWLDLAEAQDASREQDRAQDARDPTSGMDEHKER